MHWGILGGLWREVPLENGHQEVGGVRGGEGREGESESGDTKKPREIKLEMRNNKREKKRGVEGEKGLGGKRGREMEGREMSIFVCDVQLNTCVDTAVDSILSLLIYLNHPERAVNVAL